MVVRTSLGAVCHISARFRPNVMTTQVHSGTVFSVKQTILTHFHFGLNCCYSDFCIFFYFFFFYFIEVFKCNLSYL